MDLERTPEGCPQPVSDPPTYCIRAPGVLRYNRESDNHRTDLATILPAAQPLTDYPVKCEYCGENAQPSLDLTWAQESETVPLFCCAQWEQLCKMLMKQRCLIEGRCDLRTGTSTSPKDTPATKMKESLVQGKKMEDQNKFNMYLSSGHGEQSELRIHKDYSIQTFTLTSKVIRSLLSGPLENSCLYPCSANEKHLKIKEVLVPFCDHKALHFSICHHQDGTLLQKYYSNGVTFLTVLPDGSAQVFYPSGLLAVIVVTEENGRVCLVYDDGDAANQPMRAIFQSDGRATCYHSNGNIRLTLSNSGGQCLDEVGARVRRWSWNSLTPLQPVFLSINQSIGIRVLGKKEVFVSFLAGGQQAKFSLGACCAQAGAASAPSVLKEELFESAARIRIHLLIQHIHQCLTKSSCTRLLKIAQTPHVHHAAQKLLEVSADVTMSEGERAFIHRCLQDDV